MKVICRPNDLGRVLRNVSLFASRDEFRLSLTGIRLRVKDGRLTATATNAFMLGEDWLKVDETKEWPETLVKAADLQSAGVVRRCLAKGAEKTECSVELEGDRVTFTVGRVSCGLGVMGGTSPISIPDLDSFWKKQESPGRALVLNPRFLGILGKVTPRWRGNVMRLTPLDGEPSSVRVEFVDDDETFRGLVAEVRT